MYGNNIKEKIKLLIIIVPILLSIMTTKIQGASIPAPSPETSPPTLELPWWYVFIEAVLFEPKVVVIIFIIFTLINIILYLINIKRISRIKKVVYAVIETINILHIWNILNAYDIGILSPKDGYFQLCHFMDIDIIFNIILFILQLIILIQLVINIKKSKKEENPKCQE